MLVSAASKGVGIHRKLKSNRNEFNIESQDQWIWLLNDGRLYSSSPLYLLTHSGDLGSAVNQTHSVTSTFFLSLK